MEESDRGRLAGRGSRAPLLPCISPVTLAYATRAIQTLIQATTTCATPRRRRPFSRVSQLGVTMTSPIDWRTYAIDALYDSIGQRYEVAYADIPAQQRSLQ